jgi:hypothetical protein
MERESEWKRKWGKRSNENSGNGSSVAFTCYQRYEHLATDLPLPMITTSASRVLVVPLALLWSVRWRSHVSRSSSGSSSSTSNTSAANATHHREHLRWRCGNVRHRSMVDGRARSRFFLQCLVKPNAKIFGSHHRQLPRQASQDAQLCCFRVWPDRESWVDVRKRSAVSRQERVLAV